MSAIILAGDCEQLPVSLVKMYSDGTPMVKDENFPVWVASMHTMILRPTNLTDFVVAMFLVDAIESKGGKIKHLVLPYVPGARQDRVNSSGDVLFTALSVSNMINERNFSRVSILDPHSPVTPAVIKRSFEYPLAEVAKRVWPGYGGVIAPDSGAKERAETFAAALDKEVTYASKNRDVATGALSGFSVNVEKGKHYLVVDDICDGGGTFMGLAEKIREQGAFADLYVTHGIFSKGTDALKKFYKNIYTTDSRQIHERNDVLVIPVVERMKNYND